MAQSISKWKKMAMSTVALSLIVGSATGVVASAKSKNSSNDDWKKYSSNDSGKHDDDDDDDDDDDGKVSGKIQIKYSLKFKDLNEDEWKWAYAHIIRLTNHGVFKGYEDGSFKPRNNITRIETIVAAVRLLGLEAEAQKAENMNAKLSFKDFEQLKKKYPQAVGYVAVALKNDLFNENDTVVQAEKPASRLWASVLLVKAMKLEAEAKAKMGVELPFKDAAAIPAGSVGYVAVALEKGFIAGYTDGTFKPNKTVNRAELATILSRLGVQLPDQGENDNQAIVGTVTANTYGTLTVKKTDSVSVTVAVYPDVFVFRNNAKVPVTSIVAGDEVLVRTYDGKAVFIEVTKLAAPAPVALNDSGTVSAFTFNAQGKIATISITKAVNGVATTVVYNVDANVTVTGGSGVLAANLTVVLKGEGTVVKSIQITG